MAGKIPPQFLKNIKKKQGAANADDSDTTDANDSSDNLPPWLQKGGAATSKSKSKSKGKLSAAAKTAARKRALANLNKKGSGD